MEYSKIVISRYSSSFSVHMTLVTNVILMILIDIIIELSIIFLKLVNSTLTLKNEK